MQESKKLIARYIKSEVKVDTELGPIFIKEMIGEGGNAFVYKAEFGRNEVALKILAEVKNSSKYKRFITEFREIVQLAETQAVVPIYYFGILDIGEQQFPYMVMKKYPYTLKSWSDNKPINNFDDLSRTLGSLLKVISIIHERNIVHRDLKPENILVTENEEMVLADFGISWFDPDIYEKSVRTEKGDRMANFDFSAPEQFMKGSQPHPTMDIFALGQIITWLITGGVARGERKPLTEFDTSFAVIEPVISAMLQREPENRPQSVEEVREMIKTNIQEKDENARLQKEVDHVIGEMRMFNDVLLFCFPGKRGLIEIDNPNRIEGILKEINNLIGETDLWWTQGSSNCSINRKMVKINEDTWLMDSTEIQVDKIWALKNPYSLDHQFFVLRTKTMPPFGIYGEEGGSQWEEAAWYKDRYITREEYDDGVADIDGYSERLDGEEQLRIRNLHPEYFFIATQSHPILLPKNDAVVTEIYKKLMDTNYLEEADIQKLSRLGRHRISVMMS